MRTGVMILAGMTIMFAGGVLSQEFPSKPVRIVTSTPGGGSDFSARLIAQNISGPLGQQVIVDNRSGVIGQEMVAKAAPDGYTLIVDGSSLWTSSLLQTMPYDPVRDFAPVSLIGVVPNVLVVHPSLPVRSVKDLLALAKARPGQLNFSAGNIGSAAQLSGELLKSMAAVNMVMVPYKGTGPAINALLGGEVQLMFATAGSITGHLKTGRLRGLAVTSLQPSPLVPGLPTVAASGVPGYETTSSTGIWAPAKTPPAIVGRLNQEIVKALHKPDVKEKFFITGIEIVASTPEEFAQAIKSDLTKIGKLIKDAGIRMQ